MANIIFNNKNYSVDDSFLSTHSDSLKSHLSTVMNGTGAVINLGGVAYNVDATKLAAAKSAFVQHLGTIAGSGRKVVIGGIEYGIDAGKVAGAVSEIEAVLGGAISGGGEGSMPEKNEYGFYYNVPYVGDIAYEDGNTMKVAFVSYEDKSLVLLTDRYGSGFTSEFLSDYPFDYFEYNEETGYITNEKYGFTFMFSEDGKSFTINTHGKWSVAENTVFEAANMVVHPLYFDEQYASEDGSTIVFNGNVATYNKTSLGTVEYIENIEWTGRYYGFTDRYDLLVSISGETVYMVDFDEDEKVTVFTRSSSGGDEGSEQLVAGLYQTGAIALYNEQGAEAIEGMMIKSWDELVDSGAIHVDNGVVSSGMIVPDNLPEKNEYGFYFGVPYDGLAFNEDGSANIYNGDEIMDSMPSGTFKYDVNSIDMSYFGIGIVQVSNDGLTLIGDNGSFIVNIGALAQFDGDLIMPDDGSVVAFAPSSFADKTTLTGIKIPYGVTSIGEHTFAGCSNLTSVNIPDSVTSIGDFAFVECSSLTSVKIPYGVTSIGERTFAGCSNLTSVNIPDSVTSIGDLAFADCNLTSVNIPDSVTSMGVNVFSNCNNLTSVNISDGVTSIGYCAFIECSSLTSVNIPDSVTSIGVSAFQSCGNLTSIVYAGTIAQWNAVTKGGGWNYNVPATYVQCSDGQVAL